MKAKILILLILVLSFSTLFSDVVNYDKVIRNLRGVKSYDKEEFENSEDDFKHNAIKYPEDPRLHFNQANAQVKNGMLEEAEQNYKLALNNDQFKDRSKALQNLGNAKFLQKDYKNAIKNYRNALIEDPGNTDARYNYELAAKMLQRQQEQKQQQEQNKDDQNDKDEEKDKQKQQQQQDKQEDQQKDEQQKQDEKKQDEQQKSQEQKLKEQKKEDAEKTLKALLQKEKEEMEKEKQKMNVDRTKTGKYW
ncbi:MAG: tetratricopeptide repeat protein [FCB group bacterium]|nr:tetratricopeptide repeat protein [FCB group bacterium]